MTSTAPAAASSTLDANRGSFTLALLAPRRLASSTTFSAFVSAAAANTS
jgi:hypothetical protein